MHIRSRQDQIDSMNDVEAARESLKVMEKVLSSQERMTQNVAAVHIMVEDLTKHIETLGAASKSTSKKVADKDQQAVEALLFEVAKDWVAVFGADEPLDPGDIKAGAKRKNKELAQHLNIKWKFFRLAMLDAGIFVEHKEPGKANTNMQYLVGPALKEKEEDAEESFHRQAAAC